MGGNLYEAFLSAVSAGHIHETVPLGRQVMKPTRACVFRGSRRSEGKVLGLFEASTEVIRKGKAGKPSEFGKMVKLQQAENQIIVD
jgi:transposase, IS5 family